MTRRIFTNRKKQKLFSFLSGFLLIGLVLNFINPLFLFAQTNEEKKEELRQEIEKLQAQIDSYRNKIKEAGDQEQTLKGQITNLENKISKLNLEIESLSLAIGDVKGRMTIIHQTTDEINRNIIKEKEILAKTIRVVYENDSFNFVELFFREEKLSDMLADFKAIERIQGSLITSLKEIRRLKERLAEEKEILTKRENELAELKKMQDIQTASLRQTKLAKRQVLQQTESQKHELIGKVEVSQATIASIREQLYQLEGLGVSLKFGEALKYAQQATVRTGVRAALLLAMLKKESEWGTNVGTGTWREDMHSRDHDAFLAICEKLGLDPNTTPVSRKPSYGWGGAMGPAQFLPNTWLAYEKEVAQVTGHNPPNPWHIDDAFTACGIKLKKAGAAAQNYDAEWKAAQIYFAGQRWNNPRYYFYGDSVLELAGQFQQQIDILEKGES
jgi:peptidoglycan hydrolase CwlO-like protein